MDASLGRLRTMLRDGAGGRDASTIDLAAYSGAFAEAMDDDFNTPRAVAVVFDVLRNFNTMLGAGRLSLEALHDIDRWISVHAGDILGIDSGAGTGASVAGDVVPRLMDLVIGLRQDIRQQKLWPLADRIRDGLGSIGITLEDGKDGTTWKKTS